MRSIYIGAALAASLTVAAQAHAQLLNTWVSATGDDDNPCSRSLPCATFAGAIAKTNAGGIIGVLDSGEYGTVEITKSITIDGGGSLASIQTSSVLRSGVLVNAGPNDRVVLRNLSINGSHNLDQGVLFQSGRRLSIQNCLFTRFDGDTAIAVANSARSNTDVNNALVVGSSTGVSLSRPHSINDPPGFVVATMKNIQLEIAEAYVGVELGAASPSSATVTDSLMVSTGYPTRLVTTQADLNVDNSVFVHSRLPLQAGGPSATMRISGNLVMNHSNGFPDSDILSFGDNAVAGILNGHGPTGTIGFQ